MKEKQCVLCKTSFKAYSWTQKACSLECHKKYINNKPKKTINRKKVKNNRSYNKEYANWIYKNKGLLLEELGCEICSKNATVILDRHHIIFKSEAGWHKEINNPRNIVQCCRECHLKFHAKSINRNGLIKERELEKLFPELNLKNN